MYHGIPAKSVQYLAIRPIQPGITKCPLTLCDNRMPYRGLSGEEEQERFISELEGFIGQLLKMVEVELKFNYETLSKISGQIHGKDA